MLNLVSARFSAFFGAGVRIGLSGSAFAVVRQAPWGGKSTILANHALNVDHAPGAPLTETASRLVAQIDVDFRTAFAETPSAGLPVRVVLSDDLARLFMVTPPQNSARLHDIKAATSMRFQMLYGDLGADPHNDWCIEADWQASRPFLACAVPRSLVEALCRAAGEHGMHVQSIEPNFVAAWNAARGRIAKGVWFGAVYEEQLTLAAIAPNASHLGAVRSLAIPADGHELQWVEEQVARTALQLDVPVPQQLCLSGNRNQLWVDRRKTSTAGAAKEGLVINNLDQGPAVAGTTPVSAAVLLAGKAVRT
jgi:hypothetical protein